MAVLAVAALAATAIVVTTQGDEEREASSAPGSGGKQSHLVIRVVATTGATGFEGAIGYLAVTQGGGPRGPEVLRYRAALREHEIREELPPGPYRVRAFKRTCAGTCDTLDRPGVPCTVEVMLEPGGEKVVAVRHGTNGLCRARLGP